MPDFSSILFGGDYLQFDTHRARIYYCLCQNSSKDCQNVSVNAGLVGTRYDGLLNSLLPLLFVPLGVGAVVDIALSAQHQLGSLYATGIMSVATYAAVWVVLNS